MRDTLNGLLEFLGRHKIAFGATILICGLPILLMLTPLVLILTVIWLWVALSEIGSKKKVEPPKGD